MAHLSSCYFCGTALESPVQTYELSEETGESGTTVSLCPSCKEKLDIVLESSDQGALRPADEQSESTVTAGHVPDDSSGSTVTAGHVPDETTGDTTESERAVDTEGQQDSAGDGQADHGVPVQTEPETDSSEEIGPDSDALGSPDTPTKPDEEEGNQETGSDEEVDVADEGLATDEDPLTVDDESLDDDGDDGGLDDSYDEELEEGLDDSFEDDELLPEDDPLADEADSEEEESLAGETENDPTDEKAEESPDADSDPDAEDDETGNQTSSETTISALEYNRVMRMLQNREFPVDREEIVVVASNAYDLARSECNQVIDLAVDRGLLEEREGELYRPGD